MKNRLVSLLLLAVLPSCVLSRSSQNEPLSLETIQKLKPGVTTAREVVELMGAPTDVIQLGKRSAYLYEHVMSKTAGIVLIGLLLSNTDQRSDRLWVFFDEQDQVTHFGTTLATPRTTYALPWFDLYDEEEEEGKPATTSAADK